jgi:hypothetical protein
MKVTMTDTIQWIFERPHPATITFDLDDPECRQVIRKSAFALAFMVDMVFDAYITDLTSTLRDLRWWLDFIRESDQGFQFPRLDLFIEAADAFGIAEDEPGVLGAVLSRLNRADDAARIAEVECWARQREADISQFFDEFWGTPASDKEKAHLHLATATLLPLLAHGWQ